MHANFQCSGKITLFDTLTPPDINGGSNLFLAIRQKSLIIGQFACIQIFRALASKWKIRQINPIWHFNPPGIKGGSYLFLTIQQKSLTTGKIKMHSNFQGSSFKMENLKN